jgi:hypothetical protein
MKTKTKARKAAGRTAHPPHKVRASVHWALSQRPHRTATISPLPPVEIPREEPDSEAI